MVHKIRIILDSTENIFRDIEIKQKHTLWNLHEAIQHAFNLPADELSVFNVFSEDGAVMKAIPLEDMSDAGDGETMADYYIDEIFAEVGNKVQFQYGLVDLWEFFCECVEITEAKSSVKYPLITYRFGKLPLKPPAKSSGNAVIAPIDLDFADDDLLLDDPDFADDADFGDDDFFEED